MSSKSTEKKLVEFVQCEFEALRDPVNAVPMAAYMKTEMPFYGIPKPLRSPIYKQFKKQFAPQTQAEYESCVSALWSLQHREEKYAAIEYASLFDKFINTSALPLYERMIREGQWWDFIDPIAAYLIGGALRKDKNTVEKKLDKWIRDPDMWIRRTALLSQNRFKKETNEEMLYRYCLECAAEKEFFIRKAIGWALREYSYAAPNSVKKFLEQNENVLSPLSLKEGAKQLNRSSN